MFIRYVGLDVHKDSIAIAVAEDDQEKVPRQIQRTRNVYSS